MGKLEQNNKECSGIVYSGWSSILSSTPRALTFASGHHSRAVSQEKPPNCYHGRYLLPGPLAIVAIRIKCGVGRDVPLFLPHLKVIQHFCITNYLEYNPSECKWREKYARESVMFVIAKQVLWHWGWEKPLGDHWILASPKRPCETRATNAIFYRA